MENNKQKGNSKEFQAEEIDKRFEMDIVNPLPADPNFGTSHPYNDGVPGPPPPINADPTPPPQSSGW